MFETRSFAFKTERNSPEADREPKPATVASNTGERSAAGAAFLSAIDAENNHFIGRNVFSGIRDASEVSWISDIRLQRMQ